MSLLLIEPILDRYVAQRRRERKIGSLEKSKRCF
jgi:hypothetical protein